MAHTEPTPTKARLQWARNLDPASGALWRCTCCDSLLGRLIGGDVHVRFQRRHEYVAKLPASAICKSCGTLNRAGPRA